MSGSTEVQQSFMKRCVVSTHLQRDDDHKYLLLLVRQDVFHKSPAGANQSQCDEEERPLESTGHMSSRCLSRNRLL